MIIIVSDLICRACTMIWRLTKCACTTLAYLRETTQKAELIVFIDNSKVYVLRADKWPYGKSMSAAELIQYIANHVA